MTTTADIHLTRARTGPYNTIFCTGRVRLRGPRGGKGTVVFSTLPTLIDLTLKRCTHYCAANGVKLGQVTYGKGCGASMPWDSEGNLV